MPRLTRCRRIAPSGRSVAACSPLLRPRASTYTWYVSRRLPRRGNATVRAGLRHAVGFFLAYFEHCRRDSDRAAAASSGRRRSSSRSTTTTSTPATPTRHRQRRPSHGYLNNGYTILRSRLHRHRHKGLPPCLSNLVGSTSATTSRCIDRYDCGRVSVGVPSDSSPVSPSASLPL